MNQKRWIVLLSVIVLVLSITLLAGQRNSDDAGAKRTITFYDSQAQEEIIKYEVELGDSVTPPTPPTHKDYLFIGWFDENGFEITDFSKILKNQRINARYGSDKNNNGILDSEDTYYEVVFYDTIGRKNIATERVLVGLDAKPPVTPTHRGYVFDRYSASFTKVSSDLKIDLIYRDAATTTRPPTTRPTTPTTTQPKEDVYTYKVEDFDKRVGLQKKITVYRNGTQIAVKSIMAEDNYRISPYNNSINGIIVDHSEVSDIKKVELNNGQIVNIKKG